MCDVKEIYIIVSNYDWCKQTYMMVADCMGDVKQTYMIVASNRIDVNQTYVIDANCMI